MTLFTASTATATNEDDEIFTIESPAIFAPSTQLTFDRATNVGGADADVVLGHGMVPAARLATPPVDGFPITPGARLPISGGWRFRRRWPERDPVAVTALVVDPFGVGAPIGAEVDPVTAALTLGDEIDEMSLAAPVTAYGNAALLTRGETVAGEVLGSGDATIANQTFELQKPLTYLTAPTEIGYASTLVVRVDGIEIAEVPTLYGQPAETLVYMLREPMTARPG